MNFSALSLITCLAAVASCASHTNSRRVEAGMILPLGARQMDLKPNQVFLMAAPIEDRTPDYPTTGTTLSNVTICAEFVVAEDGQVHSVRQIDSAPGCETPGNATSAVFLPEVQRAVESWTFFGAALCDYERTEDECEEDTANLTPVAIKIAYRFRFSQSDGRRSVSAGTIE